MQLARLSAERDCIFKAIGSTIETIVSTETQNIMQYKASCDKGCTYVLDRSLAVISSIMGKKLWPLQDLDNRPLETICALLSNSSWLADPPELSRCKGQAATGSSLYGLGRALPSVCGGASISSLSSIRAQLSSSVAEATRVLSIPCYECTVEVGTLCSPDAWYVDQRQFAILTRKEQRQVTGGKLTSRIALLQRSFDPVSLLSRRTTMEESVLEKPHRKGCEHRRRRRGHSGLHKGQKTLHRCPCETRSKANDYLKMCCHQRAPDCEAQNEGWKRQCQVSFCEYYSMSSPIANVHTGLVDAVEDHLRVTEAGCYWCVRQGKLSSAPCEHEKAG